MKRSRLFGLLATAAVAAIFALPASGAVVTVTVAEWDDVLDEGEYFDLTHEYGTLDWAYTAGNQGENRKNIPEADRVISDLPGSITGSGDKNPTYPLTWSDGIDPEEGTITGESGDKAGFHNGDWTGTVIAPSADEFTIYVWGSVFQGTARFTATAGEASDFADYTLARNDRWPGALFTISVTPDYAGQEIELSYVETESFSGWSNPALTAIGVVPGAEPPKPESPYEEWAGEEPFDADTSGDGIPNGVAWVLGAPEPGSDVRALELLPTIETIDDNGEEVLVFAFQRRREIGDTEVVVEYSTDLADPDGWDVAEDDGVDIIISETQVGDYDDVEVQFKTSAFAEDGRLFVRLRVAQLP